MPSEIKFQLLWIGDGQPADSDQIETACGELGIQVSYCPRADAAGRLGATQFHILCLEIRSVDDLALLEKLQGHAPAAPFFVVSADTSVSTMRLALQRGAIDFITLPLNPLDLSKVLIRAGQLAGSAKAGDVSGEIITVYGVRGGLGATTLAVNLATRLHSTVAGETVLVDLDLHRGDVAAFLNLAPSQSIAALGEAPGEVDEIFLHSAMTRYGSGLFVLAAPERVEDADVVGHDEVTLALRLLRTQYRYTVVDTSRTLTAATVAAFEQSDRVLVLTDLSVPGVRSAQRTIELLERLGLPTTNLHLIVTEATPGPVELADAAKALGRDPYLVIPRDAATAAHAMNSGTPLNGKSSGGLADSLSELADKLMGSDASGRKRKGGLFRRIFSREARA